MCLLFQRGPFKCPCRVHIRQILYPGRVWGAPRPSRSRELFPRTCHTNTHSMRAGIEEEIEHQAVLA